MKYIVCADLSIYQTGALLHVIIIDSERGQLHVFLWTLTH